MTAHRPRLLPVATLLALAALASLAACSGQNAASKLLDTPTYQPRDQAKCGVAKSQAEPLIVEWPDAARGKLESMVKRGVVAVRYEGCEMEVLGQCTARGAYRYASVNPKKSLVKMRDADELYASIPAYAAKFEAALQKAGELNVSMTIVGRYEAEQRTFVLAGLEGQCEGATHVVNALTVGAFDFYAGADASIGAGVKVAGAGVGAKSTAQRETLNQDGSAEACEKARQEDTVPPYGCGALLRVEVIAIADARPARPVASPAPAIAGKGDDPPPSPEPAAAPPPPVSNGPALHGPTDDDDGDGIPNALDKCPNEPEDKDGIEDDDGCPDPDNDNDGILDVADACPNEAGPPPSGCPVKKGR